MVATAFTQHASTFDVGYVGDTHNIDGPTYRWCDMYDLDTEVDTFFEILAIEDGQYDPPGPTRRLESQEQVTQTPRD